MIGALELSGQSRAMLIDHAAQCLPNEACALLAGRLVDVEGHGILTRVTSVHLASNVAKNPTRTYIIDPRAQYLIERNVSLRDEQILGVAHSHPRGHATLSHTDREIARLRREQTGETIVFVVISMRHKEVRAYTVDAHGHADEIRIASDSPSPSRSTQEDSA